MAGGGFAKFSPLQQAAINEMQRCASQIREPQILKSKNILHMQKPFLIG
jgi:hypothetical protein